MKIVVLEADAMGSGVNFDSLKQYGEVIINAGAHGIGY